MASLLPPSPPLPIFSSPSSPRRVSIIVPNFSRWNNANAQPFVAPLRREKEIRDEIRLHRRHESASNLLSQDSHPNPQQQAPPSKSMGTPSQPSNPSIRGRKSKYSKPPRPPPPPKHPAFRPVRPRLLPVVESSDGISFKIEGAPFEFQYSYTETPKAKPIALRDVPYAPFGPSTMARPWTGRAPLPKSRRKLPEFDSFKPPRPGKKGVKPVQPPGPFLPGTGPRYVVSREEVMGDPLTDEEVNDLVKGCMKTNRQLNMGRDGLTHNMLDNIHAHWKRRRTCKIKCKGVCTIDLDNVCRQLEEKTGGKVIYRRGGVMFLFRGRNYNYKTHPKFPLMLWKPTPPVYPRLVQHVPEGLTLEEATAMRKKGHSLLPICKLAKNGVYNNVVKEIKEAFEVCELVRIDCSALKKNDTRKIGAKLQDLVPCVLLSFQFEHILMWRGKDWKSSLVPLNLHSTASELATREQLHSDSSVNSINLKHQPFAELDRILDSEIDSPDDENCTDSEDDVSSSDDDDDDEFDDCLERAPTASDHVDDGAIDLVLTSQNGARVCDATVGEKLPEDPLKHLAISNSAINGNACLEASGEHFNSETTPSMSEDTSIGVTRLGENSTSRSMSNLKQGSGITDSAEAARLDDNGTIISMSNLKLGSGDPEAVTTVDSGHIKASSLKHCMDNVMGLLKQAIENGSAIVLDRNSLDANLVYESAVILAKTAPPGPVFRYHTHVSSKRLGKTDDTQVEKDGNPDKNQVIQATSRAVGKPTRRKGAARAARTARNSNNRLHDSSRDVIPYGSLKIDELAKLLS